MFRRFVTSTSSRVSSQLRCSRPLSNSTTNRTESLSLKSKEGYLWGTEWNLSATKVFIRSAITQLKSEDHVKATEEVVDALKTAADNFTTTPPQFLTKILNAQKQKHALSTSYTAKEFRESRLSMVDDAHCFVFVYDNDALSVSGGVELGYWLAKQENQNIDTDTNHTVIVMMNSMDTTLVKQLPNCTYIQLNDGRDPEDYHDENHRQVNFPNLHVASSTSELTDLFTNVLRNLERERSEKLERHIEAH